MTQLVIFAPNWLGDAVMALPAIADVQRSDPAMRVTIAARRSVAPLFEVLGGVGVLAIEGGAARRQTLDRLRSSSFDAALLLPNSLHSALTAWRCGVPERWGYRTDCRRPLLTRAVAPPRRQHQSEYYQYLVRALGFPSGPTEPCVTVPAGVRSAAADRLREAGWDGGAPLVALAPGAAYGGAKKWPPQSFAGLAAGLASDGVVCVMVGGAADAPAVAAVVAALRTAAPLLRPIDLVGETTLSMLAGVLVHCRALVSNDSGAMHLGAALGVRVTAMFGPTNEHATRPLGPSHTVLTHSAWCRPCMLRECPLDHQCMRGIGVEDVLTAARRSL